MTNISTATRAELRETLRTMRAENLDVSKQLDLIHSDIIGMDPVTLEHNGGNTDPDQVATIRSGRLMVRCLAKNAARTAAKLRSACRTPSTRQHVGARVFPKFEQGMSTAEYVAAFETLNQNAYGEVNALPYNLTNYLTPCTLYEGGALDFDAIEEPIDAPERTEPEPTRTPEPMVQIVSGLTGAYLGLLPKSAAHAMAQRHGNTIGTPAPADYTITAARQVSELIASATTAATIEHASDPTTEDDHQDETADAGELATVDAEPCAMAAPCDASSASSTGSAATHGHASSSAHQAPAPAQRATHDANGQRIGQHVAGHSGNWCAVMFRDDCGRPAFEFEGPDGSRDVWSFETGRERMAALQAMAREADDQADQDDDATEDQPGHNLTAGEYQQPAPVPKTKTEADTKAADEVPRAVVLDSGQQSTSGTDTADEVPRAVTQGTRDNTAQAAPTVSELVALLQARGFHGVESRRRPGAVLLARRGNDYPLTYSNTTQAQRCIAKLAAAGVAASVRGPLVVVTGAMQPPAGAARTVRDIMPTDGEHISDPAGRWEAWITGTEPRACVLFYRADAFRPTYHYSYKTTDKAREALRRFADEAEAIATERDNRKAERRAKLDQPHGLAVGDVLRSSWGYDQTNTDYFEVTRVIGKRTVEVRQLAEQIEQTAWAQGNSVPVPGQYVGAPMRRQVDTQGAVNILHATYGRAYKMEPVATVAGVRCFSPSGWSSYA